MTNGIIRALTRASAVIDCPDLAGRMLCICVIWAIDSDFTSAVFFNDTTKECDVPPHFRQNDVNNEIMKI